MIEEYIPTRLNLDDSERDMAPGEYRDAHNLVVLSKNVGGRRRANSLGTALAGVFPGLIGGAKSIGAIYQDSSRKGIFFFWQNNAGDQCVIFEADGSLNPASPVITRLVSSYNMGVTSSSYLNNGRFASDLVYFNFKEASMKVINITRAKATPGFYDTLAEEALSVMKAPSLYAPVAVRVGTGIIDPPILHKPFQFSFLINFIDSERGVLSTPSDYLPAIAEVATVAGNEFIDITITVQPSIFLMVNTIELFVRNTNNPTDWRSAFVIPSVNFVLTGGLYVYTYRFNDVGIGSFLAPDDALKLVDSEPRKSNSLELVSNKLFAVDSLIDYGEEVGWDFTMALTTPAASGDDRAAAGIQIYTQDDFQYDSEYVYALFFEDRYGRRIPSASKNKVLRTIPFTYFNTPNVDGMPNYSINPNQAIMTITGKPPSYAQSVVVCRSKNIKWDWQILQKCRVRFLYSTVPWDGVSALPTDTIKEDGWIYYSLRTVGAPLQAFIQCEYIDIIVPTNFPFTVDNSLLIDIAVKCTGYNSVTPTSPFANSIIINDRTIVTSFANKIRIRVDPTIAWALYGMYDVVSACTPPGVPQFLSGRQYLTLITAAAHLPNDNDSFLPIVFKKKAVATVEATVAWSESVYQIANPGTDTRSFSAIPVLTPIIVNTDKGVASADLTVGLGEFLIQPFQINPSSGANNHRLTIPWHGLLADSVLYNVRFVLYQLDQVTKLPITELAHSLFTFTNITGGTVQYLISLLPTLGPGWYGFGIKPESTSLPQFLNNEFDLGLLNWIAPPGWVPANSGSDFYLDCVLGSGANTPDIYQFFSGVSFRGVAMSIDIETLGVVGFPNLLPYTRQPNTDASSQISGLIQGDGYIVPMFLDTFTKLILGVSCIQIFLNGVAGDGAGYFATGQVWTLDQVTKQPIALIYDSGTPVEFDNITKLFTFPGSLEINSPAWYGIGIKITTAPPAYEFGDPDFDGDFSLWIPDAVSGGGLNNWAQIGGQAICLVPPGEIDTFGLMPLTGLPSCKGVEINVSAANGTLYFLDESLHVLATLGVYNSFVITQVLFSRVLGAGERFMMKYVALNYAGVNQRIKIEYVHNLPVSVFVKTGTPATADNKYWRYHAGTWAQAAFGMPFIFFAEDSYFLGANNLVLTAHSTGEIIVIAPNARSTVTLTPLSQPGGDQFGIFVANNVSNYSARVRIRFITNIKTISGPLSTLGYLMGVIPGQQAYKYSAGAWALINRVTAFTITEDDYAFGGPLTIALKPDAYHLAQNYLERGVQSHSSDWFPAPTTPYAQGFPFPSLSSDPDLKGLAYQDKVGQSIGLPHAIFGVSKESSQSNIVRWSDNIILNSKLNGLNSFREANKFPIPFERGPVTKLIVMNNRTLVCVHESGMTSLYLNKKIVTNLSGSDLISLTDQTVGDELQLSTDLGTINPESVVVVENGTIAFGFDIRRESAWMKSNNGVRNITQEGKCVKWFGDRSRERLVAINSGVDVKIIGGYDINIKAYFLTFRGFTYNGVTYPEYTIGWSLLLNQGHGAFVSMYDFFPEVYLSETNFFFSIKNSQLWLHSYGGFMNKFYDVQNSCSIKVLLRQNDSIIKQFSSIAIDSDHSWKITQLRTSKGNVSRLDYQNFLIKNGRFYADFLRDENTPADMLQAGETPLLDGFLLTGNWIEFTLVNETGTERVTLDGIYVGYEQVGGHLLHK